MKIVCDGCKKEAVTFYGTTMRASHEHVLARCSEHANHAKSLVFMEISKEEYLISKVINS